MSTISTQWAHYVYVLAPSQVYVQFKFLLQEAPF